VALLAAAVGALLAVAVGALFAVAVACCGEISSLFLSLEPAGGADAFEEDRRR
jgi:hypothetical protein